MYAKFFHLKAKPFQLTPDPRFFFGSKGHKRALAYLQYGIQQGEGFIVITGDVGTGKTTLVSTLFKVLAKKNIIAAQLTNTQIQEDDLLRMVSAAFGLPFQQVGKAAILANLENFFLACAKEGKRVLLVVDEAQNLPKRSIEELRMLSNFQMGGRPLLQSFLLGQREFRTTMRSQGFEQMRQRVIAAYHLKPLDIHETRAYIEHRLHLVGWKNDPVFDDDSFASIYQFTAGVPRRINNFCDRIMLYLYLEQMHRVDVGVVEAVAEEVGEEFAMPEAGLSSVDAFLGPDHDEGVTSQGSASANNDDLEKRLAVAETALNSLRQALHQQQAGTEPESADPPAEPTSD